MRINDNALRHFAASHKADKQGTLFYRPPRDSAKTRYFKLIGNLLFHYKHGKSLPIDAAPDETTSIGLMVVERCRILSVGDRGQLDRMFSITFEGESNQKHYFTAATATDCVGWVTALKLADYAHIKSELIRLRQEIHRRTGSDLCDAVHKKMFVKLNEAANVSQRSVKNKDDFPSDTVSASKDKTSGSSRGKTKGGSTFYLKHSDGLMNKTCSKSQTMVNPQGPIEPRSRFFTELESVQVMNKPQITGNQVLSSEISQLRSKAMTLNRSTCVNNVPTSRPASQTVQIRHPPHVPGTRNSSNRGAIYSEAPSRDLIDFSGESSTGCLSDIPQQPQPFTLQSLLQPQHCASQSCQRPFSQPESATRQSQSNQSNTANKNNTCDVFSQLVNPVQQVAPAVTSSLVPTSTDWGIGLVNDPFDLSFLNNS